MCTLQFPETIVTFLAMEQRKNTKFCFKRGKTPVEAYEMLQTVCGDEALSRNSVFEWFKRSTDVREDLQDEPRSVSPSTSRNADINAYVREMVTRGRRWALRMMSDEVNINKETIRQILRKIYGRGRSAQSSSHSDLTDKLKQRSLTSCQGFVQTCQGNPSFLDCISLS
jgi:hypothetical protein